MLQRHTDSAFAAREGMIDEGLNVIGWLTIVYLVDRGSAKLIDSLMDLSVQTGISSPCLICPGFSRLVAPGGERAY